MKECTTHHCACDCREEKIRRLVEAVERVLSIYEEDALILAYSDPPWDCMKEALAEVKAMYPEGGDMKEDFIQNRFGYCFYEIKESSALIYNLYVHPEHRLKGMAKMLLQYVINEIRTLYHYDGEIEIDASPREGVISLEKLGLFYKKMGLKVLNIGS